MKVPTCPDSIPIKVIKPCANIIDSHLTYIINKDRKTNKYSENTKQLYVGLYIRKVIEIRSKIIDQLAF